MRAAAVAAPQHHSGRFLQGTSHPRVPDSGPCYFLPHLIAFPGTKSAGRAQEKCRHRGCSLQDRFINRIPRNRRNLLRHGRRFVNWPHRLQLHWSLAPLPPQARDILKHLQSPSWLLASLRTPQPTQSIFPAKTQASPSPGSPACRPLHSPQAALHGHCCWEMLLIELC